MCSGTSAARPDGSESAAPDMGQHSVAAVLADLHPETWKAVLARAERQTDTFPSGMNPAAEPAYRYIPGDGGG